MRSLVFQDLDNVEAVLGLDQVGDLAWCKRESGLFEFGNRLALTDKTQISAFVFGARILGILLGQFVELRAFLGLLQDILGLFPNFLDDGIGCANGLEK